MVPGRSDLHNSPPTFRFLSARPFVHNIDAWTYDKPSNAGLSRATRFRALVFWNAYVSLLWDENHRLSGTVMPMPYRFKDITFYSIVTLMLIPSYFQKRKQEAVHLKKLCVVPASCVAPQCAWTISSFDNWLSHRFFTVYFVGHIRKSMSFCLFVFVKPVPQSMFFFILVNGLTW